MPQTLHMCKVPLLQNVHFHIFCRNHLVSIPGVCKNNIYLLGRQQKSAQRETFSACARHTGTKWKVRRKKGADSRLWLMARCKSYQRSLSGVSLCWYRIAASPAWHTIPGIGLCFSTALPALSKLARALATPVCNVHAVSVK